MRTSTPGGWGSRWGGGGGDSPPVSTPRARSWWRSGGRQKAASAWCTSPSTSTAGWAPTSTIPCTATSCGASRSRTRWAARARSSPGSAECSRRHRHENLLSMKTNTTLRYDHVQVGDEVPTLVIPLTRTLIVATAIASRDYQDVHHDPGLAQERGSPDIFMNILSTNGFVRRFITDWAGPDGVLKSVKIRLGAPNHPGDTMTMTGQVTAKDDGVIEVHVRGANDIGDHVTGTVALELPR